MRPLPTLRQLRYLVALADHLHFGRAAEACLVTQSTLSAGLQELETLMGVMLVERTRRRVMLTPLGTEMVARARLLLREAEDLTDTARAAAEPLTGPLRLGVIPTIGPYLLPRALPALREAYPRLKLYLREDLSARLLDQLNSGALDALLLALPYPAEEVEFEELCQDDFLLVAPPSHPLAARPKLVPEDLAGSELLLLEEGHCLREHALAACRLAAPGGVQGTSLATLVQMVAGGLGVTLLPRLAVEGDVLRGTDLVARPVEGGEARRLGLMWRRSSPRGREFRLLAQALRQARPPVPPLVRAAQAIPLEAGEFAGLMPACEPFPKLAVAVSGGADSMALALLAAEWTAERGGGVTALTVDHGLRPESAAEAAQVGLWLAARGISHAVLRWEGDKPASGVQEAARKARYGLLLDWCRRHGVLHCLLAHHRDDQAETLLLRLSRGSGLDGLAAMAVVSETETARLLRPLLGVPPQRLRATLRARGQDWIEDPGNRNPAFARVRLRGLLPELEPEGLAESAAALRQTRCHLETECAALLARHVEPSVLGFAWVAPEIFSAPRELARRALGRLLACYGGAAYAPRRERLDRLLEELRHGLDGARTLGGCMVAPRRGRLLVCREDRNLAPP
ncbi:MAG: tRNA lysidine(34) synthetase TilS, partial [Rhodospirillales bacterium]|nr:tRNA lysidine(34) synthetase TilS [Rhodospirillales bacterium]